MLLPLSSQNVIQHLQAADLCSSEDGKSDIVELPISKKNYNLVVNLADNRKLLVKQERGVENDGILHELFNEWLFHQLLQKFPILGNISAIAPLVVHFDEENSILVRSYLSEYLDLAEFYQNPNVFPKEIAAAIGTTLAALHRTTFQGKEYRDFMATAPQGQFRYHFYNPAQGISSLNPEIFGRIPTEALKFHVLYQCYESLEAAIADLAYEWDACCLTHNDLKLNNILIHSRWNQLDNCLVQLIDWEACTWGDPAFDLGTILASYLEIWLESLVVDPTLELAESLELVMIPLEEIQPSLVALLQAYLQAFPMILEYHPNFLVRVIKFIGLALIHQIQDKINNCKLFDNSHLYMLQVAKNLLTMPEQSILSIFGISEAEILSPVAKVPQVSHPEKEKQLVPLYYEKTRLRGC
ncbi:Aminoglycoside phosphotransferase [Trichormus variabilis ATCC 29413]|uniref:Aminoglycoside phosphotransferase n=2 Tax=Anabaena variabilis TaxID=264691 RepID=Q3MG65_TRIV2|nr:MULTISPECIES: aminoglycoside phosphotransferase family protein [Nostocaceae]ABA20021.1 Aminoglycoside phosphotransferase [Trichormus variabilis ATCC 29413]MBC1214291.1 aminoglycoside phosphotransferase family protein [Trichormus variabilis ARAD]MBC1257386.1 aminoglycoside phosphotransferase family protein [Trichormus variabilis V5]MBC1268339.1 aminoglycoside phosphotransferase family protein [Trichormus variabilis FSR]MBC1302795.1 aminoglycoside phosphotransferase family protein [Trichormus